MMNFKQSNSENNAHLKQNNLFTIAQSIFDISQELFNIYKTEPIYRYPIDVLQYSHLCETYAKMLIDISEDPLKFLKSEEHFLREFTDLSFSTYQKFLGIQENTQKIDITIPKDDRRFSNKIWEENPYYKSLKSSYYLITEHSLKWLHSLSTINRKTKQQLHLYVKNFLDFLCPTNFLPLNPEVLEAIIETGSENLLSGYKNFLQDLVENKGRININKTDLKAFKVGKNIAVTPGKIIFQNDLMQLIQYLPTTKEVYKIPILFIPPWINKYYVLDLSPENSIVRWLVSQGFTVYMISWVNPLAKLSGKEFADYMLEGPLAALDIITETTQCPSVHMVGYCIGGTLLGCTLAYMAKVKDNRAASSTYFMTLLDFTNPGELGVFIDESQLDMLDKIMSEKGYLDGRLLDMVFNILRPNDLIWPYFINSYLLGKPPKPFDLLYWNSDSTNLPYRMYSFYLRNMYLRNRLKKPNKLSLRGVPLNLKEITVPSFFLASETDHITLWKSAFAGTKLMGGPVEFVLSGSGHVRGVVNPPAQNKYNYFSQNGAHRFAPLPLNPKEWLQTAIEHKGSWWPHWSQWLMNIDNEKVDASSRDPEKMGLEQIGLRIIEDAPGSYVLRRL